VQAGAKAKKLRVTNPAPLDDGEWKSLAMQAIPKPKKLDMPLDEPECGRKFFTFEYMAKALRESEYDHWVAIHAFAVQLEDVPLERENSAEFLDAVRTAGGLRCTVGESSYRDCSFDRKADLGAMVAMSEAFKGTTLTYQRLEFLPGAPRGLVWRYGTKKPGNLSSGLAWLHPLPGKETQLFNESLSFEMESYNRENNVAATAYVLVQHLLIPWTADKSDWSNYEQVYWDNDGRPLYQQPTVDPDGDGIHWIGPLGYVSASNAICEKGE